MNKTGGKYGNTLRFAGLATQWALMMLLAVWAGIRADRYTGWRFPVFIWLLPLIALVFALWQLIRTLNKPGK